MVAIVFGTESGNAEMVAEEMRDALRESGRQADVLPMDDCEVGDLKDQGVVVLVCSTYGEGELPATALPFVTGLRSARPDLSSVRFAAFGLGDSTYDTYNQGIDSLVEIFSGLGAVQVGETGRHDADGGTDAAETGASWVRETFAAHGV